MRNQPAASRQPRRHEVWQEADGTLLLCVEPGRTWAQFGSCLLVSATDPDLALPLTLLLHADGTRAEGHTEAA